MQQQRMLNRGWALLLDNSEVKHRLAAYTAQLLLGIRNIDNPAYLSFSFIYKSNNVHFVGLIYCLEIM